MAIDGAFDGTLTTEAEVRTAADAALADLIGGTTSDLADHLADTTDAHDASAVSFVPAGTISSSNVQDAIEEVATDAAAALDAVFPGDEIELTTGHGDELAPAKVRAFTSLDIDPLIPNGALTITAPDWDGAPDPPPIISLLTGIVGEASSSINLTAELVRLYGAASVIGDLAVSGLLNATMGSGSVGTGTFRDSVDARVSALAQPLDTDLSAIAALTSAADKLPYATGAGTWALTDITLAGRLVLAGADGAAIRVQLNAGALHRTVNSQTGTSYTLVLTDDDKVIQVSNAATHTLTIPPNSSVAFANGTQIQIDRIGAGAVNIAAGVGVTINSRGGLLGINGQYGSVRLRKRASDTWVLTGDLV